MRTNKGLLGDQCQLEGDFTSSSRCKPAPNNPFLPIAAKIHILIIFSHQLSPLLLQTRLDHFLLIAAARRERDCRLM
jgi:hypothetical protein